MAKKPTTTDPLLSAPQVCAELGGITRTTLWRWRREGVLPEPVQIRGRNYWRQSVIERVKGQAPEVAA